MQRRTVLGAVAVGLVTNAVAGFLRLSTPGSDQHDVTRVYRLLDDARHKVGLAGLTPHSLLGTLTYNHSVYMQVMGHVTHQDRSGHSPDQRAAKLGYEGQILGEALAETYDTADETITYWLSHAATRAVLMDPQAREIGIAMKRDIDGKMWWTVIVSRA